MSAPDSKKLLSESKVFCMMPWVGMSVDSDGSVFPCCRADKNQPSLANLRSAPLKEAWNSEGLRRVRRNMLDGKRSPECVNCYELEDARSESLRESTNGWFGNYFDVVRSTSPDGTVAAFRLPRLEIRFSNLCNYRCRTCHLGFSSAWFEDAKLLHELRPDLNPSLADRILRPTQDPDELLSQVEEILPTVQTIFFSGGESLLMEEHRRVLEMLIDRKMFHVVLDYTTNFSVAEFKGTDFFKTWERFEHVRVAASLDAMGPRAEYLRKGQKWDRILENRKRMLAECPRTSFCLVPTLSVFNSLHLPDFHWDWLERGYVSPRGVHINVLLGPEEYRIQILPARLKERVRESYRRHQDRLLARFGAEAGGSAAEYDGLVEFMDRQDVPARLPRFRELTRALDGFRGERFEQAFPELAELMDE